MAFVPIYILILGFTVVIDYFAGILIEDAEGKRRKSFLIISLISNIGVLAVFKYYNFLNDNLSFLTKFLGYENPVPYLQILLPIGLSFHTFQAMSYTIEVYKGRQKAERHFGIYSLYVMFFPQLVAGPIERPQNILPQLRSLKYDFDSERVVDGVVKMLWGFFKKIVIADRLAIYVDQVYSAPTEYSSLNLVIATYFFAIQIYCDFSGYSDIAIGCSKILGIDLMENFKYPYFSRNIKEFWSKWHISLTTWFKDYVYIPLGGNKVSQNRMLINISLVFLISGLWHGASWTFIIWGILHAVYYVVYVYYSKLKLRSLNKKFVDILSIFITFNFVAFAWIFFRANSLNDAMIIAKNILSLNNIRDFRLTVPNFGIFSLMLSLLLINILVLVEYLFTTMPLIFDKQIIKTSFSIICLTIIFLIGVYSSQSFIYFQF